MHPRPVQLEPLESRRLLNSRGDFDHDFAPPPIPAVPTAALVIDSTPIPFLTGRGTLVVKGGDDANALVVVRDGNLIKASRIVGGGFSGTVIFHASEVKRVLVEAGGGNDKVFIDNGLAKRTTSTAGRATIAWTATAARR